MKTTLELGPDVVQRLIPHRRPLLMVDRIESFEDGPTPALTASRFISANEPVFDGHFPGLSLWPGVYTIEGLLQASNLCHILWVARQELAAAGGNADDVFAALKNLELGYRLNPGFDPSSTSASRRCSRKIRIPSRVAGSRGRSTSSSSRPCSLGSGSTTARCSAGWWIG